MANTLGPALSAVWESLNTQRIAINSLELHLYLYHLELYLYLYWRENSKKTFKRLKQNAQTFTRWRTV